MTFLFSDAEDASNEEREVEQRRERGDRERGDEEIDQTPQNMNEAKN